MKKLISLLIFLIGIEAKAQTTPIKLWDDGGGITVHRYDGTKEFTIAKYEYHGAYELLDGQVEVRYGIDKKFSALPAYFKKADSSAYGSTPSNVKTALNNLFSVSSVTISGSITYTPPSMGSRKDSTFDYTSSKTLTLTNVKRVKIRNPSYISGVQNTVNITVTYDGKTDTLEPGQEFTKVAEEDKIYNKYTPISAISVNSTGGHAYVFLTYIQY